MHICIYGFVLIVILVASIIIFVYKFRRSGRMYANGRSVVITGCDRGFGFHVAKQLDRLGFVVFAGCLHVDGPGPSDLKQSSKRIHLLQLDVTKENDVTEAVKFVEDHTENKGLWGVINNAELCVFAECEWCPLDIYQQLIDVNLTGLIRVTKAFLPLIRRSQGRVVNVASLAGRFGLPGFTAYSATKFGVVGFSECLRREMSKFNIKVITIEPMIYKTPLANEDFHIKQNDTMWQGCSDSVKDDYGEAYFQDFKSRLRNLIRNNASVDISPVIDVLEDAICCKYPNCRYVPEMYYSVTSDILSLFPYNIQDMASSVVMDGGLKPNVVCQDLNVKKKEK